MNQSTNTSERLKAEIYSHPAAAWLLVAMLTFAYILSYTDRYVIYLLNTAIKADFGLTDTDMGLLMGPAFGILYATMGVPLGMLADRARRLTIISVGVMVWSLATIACGLAKNFTELFISRMVVGVGEACLSPCALSLISDSFPKEKRGLPIAVYFTALSVGAGLANLILPPILEFSKNNPTLPIIGDSSFWQTTFVLVGLPGLLFAFIIIFFKEPTRKKEEDNKDKKVSINAVFKQFFAKEWKLMVTLYLTYGMMTIVAYSHSWLPAMFETVYGWPREVFSHRNGIAIIASLPLASLGFGWLSDKLIAKKLLHAPMTISLICFFIMCITNIIAPFLSAWVCFVLLIITTVAIIGMTVLGPTAILFIVPSQIRGVAIALYFMTISLTGLFLGPTTIGYFNDVLFESSRLDYAMSASILMYAIPATFCAVYCYKSYCRYVSQNN